MSKYAPWLSGIAALVIALGLLSALFFASLFLLWIITVGVTLYIVSLIPTIVRDDSTQTPTERDTARFKRLEVMTALIATVGGLFALNIYQTTNVIAVRSSLETRDSQTRQIYYTKDGGRLMKIFTNDPGDMITDDTSCKQVQDKIAPWAREVVLAVVEPNNRDKVPQWRSNHDLYDSLFDLSTESSPGMDDIKRGFFQTVDLLFIVYDAYSAKEQHIFSDDEYEMWAAYIDDLGTSPYFLMAIIDAHEYGYTTKAFSKEIWRRFSKKNNPRLHCFAQVLYPKLAVEMEEEWMEDWGKLRFTGSRKAKDR